MKINKFIRVCICILPLLIISSCGEKGANSKNIQTGSSHFTAIINEKPYKAVHISGFVTLPTNTLLLTGAMGNGEDIQLFLPKDITAGTYDFPSIQGKYQENDEQFGFATNGTLTIDSHRTTNKTIKGSFHFTTKPAIEGDPSFTITDGSFNVSY